MGYALLGEYWRLAEDNSDVWMRLTVPQSVCWRHTDADESWNYIVYEI